MPHRYLNQIRCGEQTAGCERSACLGGFAERPLWNVRRRRAPAYSTLMLAARITLAHFSVCSAMNLANSTDELGNTAAPRSANRALSLGSARPALISLLSWSMTAGGVFFGAPTPCHPTES